MNSNRTVVDLNKVSYANFYWATSFGLLRKTKPTTPTVNGVSLSKTDFAPAVIGVDGKEVFPRESMVARATRRKLIDSWEPHCVLQLSNSHSLTYTGAKAQSIWKEWNRRQFKKKG